MRKQKHIPRQNVSLRPVKLATIVKATAALYCTVKLTFVTKPFIFCAEQTFISQLPAKPLKELRIIKCVRREKAAS